MSLNSNYDQIQNKINNNIIYIFKLIIIFFNKNYNGFINFIIQKNIIQLIIGLIIAIQISRFTDVFNTLILVPIFNYINTKNINNYSFTSNILGIEIKYGKLLIAFIELFISLIIIYLIWYLTRITNFDFIGNKLNDISILIGATEYMNIDQ